LSNLNEEYTEDNIIKQFVAYTTIKTANGVKTSI